jgi:chromosomal replication initiator protein
VSLTRFVVTPETRSALHAVRQLAAAVAAGRRAVSPLVLHGPPGTGKTHLAAGLLDEVSRGEPPRTARLIAAADLAADPPPDGADAYPEALQGAGACDLVIVEDLQHLPARAADALARLIDHRRPRRRPLVVTANAGPARLPGLPPRLTSRLCAGLVVGLEPLSAPSRRAVLHDLARQRDLATAAGVLDWLADATPGGVRPLLGALSTLAALTRTVPFPPELPAVQAHWAELGEKNKPTLERVAQRVAAYYRLDVKTLRGRNRQPRALGPCQVAMYLARELTGLAWPRIGTFFGGRDPSTVRHAYGKIAESQAGDAGLAAALRQLRAELQ